MEDITKKVAKIRLWYHLNALDVCNILNQLKILDDEKAELKAKNHVMESLDCYERLGYDLSELKK